MKTISSKYCMSAVRTIISFGLGLEVPDLAQALALSKKSKKVLSHLVCRVSQQRPPQGCDGDLGSEW